MNNRANIFTAFAIAAAMYCACNGSGSGPIYSNSEYSWEGDSIVQDSLLAVVEPSQGPAQQGQAHLHPQLRTGEREHEHTRQ